MKRISEFIKKHPIVTLLIGAVLALAIILIIVTVRRLNSASLRIVTAPSSAEVVVDGTVYTNGFYDGLSVGQKHVEVRAEGFETESFDMEFAADDTTKIYLCLKTDDEALTKTDDYINNCDLVKEYHGEQETLDFYKKYPIHQDIPIVVEWYSDDYTVHVSYRIDLGEYKNCQSEYCLKITDLSGGNRDRAIQEIRNRGYNPDDYEILYEDSSRSGHAG